MSTTPSGNISIVQNIRTIWQSVESKILQLLEIEGSQSNLILDEIRNFSRKLDGFQACGLAVRDNPEPYPELQGEDEVEVHAGPGMHQTSDISPEHSDSQSCSHSTSTGDQITETESIDTFSQTVNKPQLRVCAPNMSLSLSQAELDEVLDDLTSQSPLPAAPINTVESSTPPSDYDATDRCATVEGFKEQRDRPVNELADSSEIASRRESGTQIQELPLDNKGPLISGQIQSPTSGSEQHIGERGLEDETPEQQSESAHCHITPTGDQTTEIEGVDTFSQADKLSPLPVYPLDTNSPLGQAKPHGDLDLSSPRFPPYALIGTIESSSLQSYHAVTSACSTVEASEERTDQPERRLTSSGESENGCASGIGGQPEEPPFSSDDSSFLSTPSPASVEEANISCQEGPKEQTLEQQLQLDANSEDSDSTADTCNRHAETQSGELEEQEVGEQSRNARWTLRPRNPSSTAMHTQREELQQAKRKSSEHMSREGSRKKLKTQRQSDNIRSAFFKELERIPQDIIQPSEVYHKLLRRCGNVDEEYLWLFARLFYAVASPDAFSQLRDACVLVREGGEYKVSQQTDTVGQTIKALDGLETAASTHAILRRYHLTRLVEHRNDKEDLIAQQGRRSKRMKLKNTPPEGSGHKDEQIEGYGRISSMVLSSLMAEAYPELERPSRMQNASSEYKKRHKSLQNMLSAGRNWHLMQRQFSPGILALIPTGGENGVQNYEVERIPASLFPVFLHVLEELRGEFLRKVSNAVSAHIRDILYKKDLSWKYVFERMDVEALRRERLDSPGFIRFCELDE